MEPTIFDIMFQWAIIWVVPVMAIWLLLLAAIVAILWMFRKRDTPRGVDRGNIIPMRRARERRAM